ncbi:epoxide hydrolase [Devosia sp. Root413D1]|uniref:epoxide hydrolase family protein n=1 Tax=Devosia sp. Root413D1 TaxID=1736531 RepID=UPI0006FC7A16|nr:epoxide hydrolase family protein [Devosia sp. Root413D1]KQW76859.1 epoxide hydrolase [Devosia sp. Root413D1]
MATLTPFKIDVSAAQLQDLKDRLARTVMPSEVDGNWAAGPTNAYVRGAVDRLLGGFDWRKAEAEINQLPQFTTEIDGQNVHFIHVKSAEKNATPLLLIHGWPGSIVEFLDVIGPLTNPVAHGGRAEDAFDVVVPSLPGFGFSGPTREAGWNNVRIGKAFIELMSRLGYQRFGVQGGDAGAIIGPEIGRLAPERVIGVHLNAATMGFIPFGPVSPEEIATFTDSEKVRLQRVQRFMAEHFGFNVMQSSRPQTLAYGISDSPAGLLAWISELFTSFGDRVDAVPMDRFLTNFMIYWFTGTAASSIRLYYENAHDPEAWSPKANSGVPTGVAVFGFDEVPIRRYGETSNTIVRWNEFDVGGHYAVLEVPGVWVGDVRGFFSQIG